MSQKTRLKKAEKPKLFRITNPEITAVALCKRGKNRIGVLYKSDDGNSFKIELLTKAGEDFDEQGLILALAYAPNFPDADNHYATPEDIVKMAHSHALNGFALNDHHEKSIDPSEVAVVESFIVQKGDTRFAGWQSDDGRTVPHEGAWGQVIQVHSEERRKAYRKGEWNGVSIEGTGRLVAADEKTLKSETNDMDLEKLLEGLTASFQKAVEPLTTKIGELQEALKKATEVKPKEADEGNGKPKPEPAPVAKAEKPSQPKVNLTDPNSVAEAFLAKQNEALHEAVGELTAESLGQLLVKMEGGAEALKKAKERGAGGPAPTRVDQILSTLDLAKSKGASTDPFDQPVTDQDGMVFMKADGTRMNQRDAFGLADIDDLLKANHERFEEEYGKDPLSKMLPAASKN